MNKQLVINIGDIVTDVIGNQWIVWEKDDLGLYITDYKEQIHNCFMMHELVQSIEEKPSNVFHLFIAKRHKNLKKYGKIN